MLPQGLRKITTISMRQILEPKNKHSQMRTNVPLGDLAWGTWFLQAQAGKVVWVHGFAAETRVFDTEGCRGVQRRRG